MNQTSTEQLPDIIISKLTGKYPSELVDMILNFYNLDKLNGDKLIEQLTRDNVQLESTDQDLVLLKLMLENLIELRKVLVFGNANPSIHDFSNFINLVNSNYDIVVNRRIKGIFNNISAIVYDYITTIVDLKKQEEQTHYKEIFSSSLPEEVFQFVSNDQEFMQSLQGTLAAIDIIASEDYSKYLNNKLELAYPGSGSHLTPLLIAFDLIGRGVIENANLYFVDLLNYNPYISKKLTELQNMKFITDLDISTTIENPNQTLYTFTYQDKVIQLFFTQGNSLNVNEWLPSEDIINMIYDHFPAKSACHGEGTLQFIRRDSQDRPVTNPLISIVTGEREKEYLEALADGRLVIESESIPNVAYGNKDSWTVDNKKGPGLTVFVIDKA